MLLKRKKNIHTHAYIHLTCWLNNCNEKKQKNPYKKRESLKTTFPKNLKVNKKEKNNNSKSMILTDSLF